MNKEFEGKIINIIEERQSVIYEIERVLFTRRYNLSQKHYDIFAVHSITMLYSIWEGFIHQVFQGYIHYLNSLNIEMKKLCDNIYIYHMENTFKQLREYPDKYNKKILYFNKLRDFFGIEHHNIYSPIDTESNVGFETLNKLLNIFSLEIFPKNWGKYKYPNPNLEESLKTFLRYRNGVAHGGDISSEEKITHAIFEKYKNLVLDLMYEVHIKIINGVNKKTYIKYE